MDFELTEDQRLLKEMVRDFSQNEIAPQVKHLEDNKEFPDKILAKLGELGILGMTVPTEYGGIKTDYLSAMLALEEISKVSSAVAVIVSVHCGLFCHAILDAILEAHRVQYPNLSMKLSSSSSICLRSRMVIVCGTISPVSGSTIAETGISSSRFTSAKRSCWARAVSSNNPPSGSAASPPRIPSAIRRSAMES